MRQIFLHIGYPKTASTTLQDHVFPGIPGINFIPQAGPITGIMEDVYFARENACRRKVTEYRSRLEKITGDSEQARCLFSSESLTSFSMYFRFQPKPYVWTVDPNSIARKLKTVFVESGAFDQADIIIMVRRQEDLLKSMYAQVYNRVYRRFTETRSFDRFLDYALFDQPDAFITDALYFENVIQVLDELFGREHVHALVYEELAESPTAFAVSLASALSTEPGPIESAITSTHENVKRLDDAHYRTDERSLSDLLGTIKYRLLGNRRLGVEDSRLANLLRSFSVPATSLNLAVSPRHQQRIHELFAASNKELCKSRGLHLDRYGYY